MTTLSVHDKLFCLFLSFFSCFDLVYLLILTKRNGSYLFLLVVGSQNVHGFVFHWFDVFDLRIVFFSISMYFREKETLTEYCISLPQSHPSIKVHTSKCKDNKVTATLPEQNIYFLICPKLFR